MAEGKAQELHIFHEYRNGWSSAEWRYSEHTIYFRDCWGWLNLLEFRNSFPYANHTCWWRFQWMTDFHVAYILPGFLENWDCYHERLLCLSWYNSMHLRLYNWKYADHLSWYQVLKRTLERTTFDCNDNAAETLWLCCFLLLSSVYQPTFSVCYSTRMRANLDRVSSDKFGRLFNLILVQSSYPPSADGNHFKRNSFPFWHVLKEIIEIVTEFDDMWPTTVHEH